jgi:hypothetical protein
MTAWQEYLAGTDPTNRGSALSVGIGNSNGNTIVTYPALTATGVGYLTNAMRYYGLESVTNLLSGAWQPVPGATNILGNNSIKVFTNAISDQMRFYRVRATLQ